MQLLYKFEDKYNKNIVFKKQCNCRLTVQCTGASKQLQKWKVMVTMIWVSPEFSIAVLATASLSKPLENEQMEKFPVMVPSSAKFKRSEK